MATPSNTVPTPHVRSRALGVLVAGGILFVIGIGGSGVLHGADAGAGTQSYLELRVAA
ncbi:MAG: hypothetical protein ACLPJH_04640 [Myxococcaceae bacterium]